MKLNTPMKSIRKKCLECSGDSPKNVAECHITDCPLYAYRFGKNPKRAGIGNRDGWRNLKENA
jgi:hypothetical protein